MIQQIDSNMNPIGPLTNATSTNNANDGNYFKYTAGGYQYNLDTSTMAKGEWALYVYLIDNTGKLILMEDPPIDGVTDIMYVK